MTTTSPSPAEPFLQSGDRIELRSGGSWAFTFAGNRYRIEHGEVRLECRSLTLGPSSRSTPTTLLAVRLDGGRLLVRSGSRPRRALVLTHELLAFATTRDTDFVVDRNPAARGTRAWTRDKVIIAAQAADQSLRIDTRASYTAISNAHGIRLDVWPFSLSPLQRPTAAGDGLPAYWADGLPCSVGCTPAGAIAGWPLQPFHQQHAIRAGINELRPQNFHVGVDIQADTGQPVYAIQSGRAYPRPTGSYGDYQVDVGNFIYWHIVPAVANGQFVTAYRTILGRVENGFGHIAFSEGSSSDYLNPLRPGGSLRPYTDTEAPVIGIPHVFGDGQVTVGAFDPQSFIHQQSYLTPVLAPSSLAWRLYDARGRRLTGLEWAMRGSQNYPPGLRSTIFAPGAANPGFACFFTRQICIPNWVYRLAGGLTPPLPLASLPAGQYRLTIYAWDWKGNTSALDYRFRWPLARRALDSAAEFGPLLPRYDP